MASEQTQKTTTGMENEKKIIKKKIEQYKIDAYKSAGWKIFIHFAHRFIIPLNFNIAYRNRTTYRIG